MQTDLAFLPRQESLTFRQPIKAKCWKCTKIYFGNSITQLSSYDIKSIIYAGFLGDEASDRTIIHGASRAIVADDGGTECFKTVSSVWGSRYQQSET